MTLKTRRNDVDHKARWRWSQGTVMLRTRRNDVDHKARWRWGLGVITLITRRDDVEDQGRWRWSQGAMTLKTRRNDVDHKARWLWSQGTMTMKGKAWWLWLQGVMMLITRHVSELAPPHACVMYCRERTSTLHCFVRRCLICSNRIYHFMLSADGAPMLLQLITH